MILLKEKEVFKELIEATSTEMGIPEIIIEKDYMVSVLLERLAKIEQLQIVFKGGTSLSKCYSVIKRFSEDIDITILMKPSQIKNSVRKQLKQEILKAIEAVNFEHINQDDVRSRRDFNQYVIKYPKLYEASAPVNPYIILETIVAYEPYPCEAKKVSNYIGDYLEETSNYKLLELYDLQGFNMLVQSIDRTFIDKLYAICDYHLVKNYTRYSRHIYDLHMIWNSGNLNNCELKRLALMVAKDRQRLGARNFSCEPGMYPNNILKEIVSENVFRDDYASITSNLIFDDTEYDQCIKTLELIIEEAILPVKIMAY